MRRRGPPGVSACGLLDPPPPVRRQLATDPPISGTDSPARPLNASATLPLPSASSVGAGSLGKKSSCRQLNAATLPPFARVGSGIPASALLMFVLLVICARSQINVSGSASYRCSVPVVRHCATPDLGSPEVPFPASRLGAESPRTLSGSNSTFAARPGSPRHPTKNTRLRRCRTPKC